MNPRAPDARMLRLGRMGLLLKWGRGTTDETNATSRGLLHGKQVHWETDENSLEIRCDLIGEPGVSLEETFPPQ